MYTLIKRSDAVEIFIFIWVTTGGQMIRETYNLFAMA